MRRLLFALAIVLTGCRVVGPVVMIEDSPDCVVHIQGTDSEGHQGKSVGVDPVAAVGLGGSTAELTSVGDDSGATPTTSE